MKQDVEVGHLEEFQGHERGNQAWALLLMLRRDILLPRRRLSRQTLLLLLLLPLPLQVSLLLQVQVQVLRLPRLLPISLLVPARQLRLT